jgi:hypothetical protein
VAGRSDKIYWLVTACLGGQTGCFFKVDSEIERSRSLCCHLVREEEEGSWRDVPCYFELRGLSVSQLLVARVEIAS